MKTRSKGMNNHGQANWVLSNIDCNIWGKEGKTPTLPMSDCIPQEHFI